MVWISSLGLPEYELVEKSEQRNTRRGGLVSVEKQGIAMNKESEKILETLQSAVNEALDKKRRLEQYAVVWRNNRVEIIENNDKALANQKPDRQQQ